MQIYLYLKSSHIFLLFFILNLLGCKNNASFEREQEVINYLQKIHSVELSDQAIVIMLQTNFCGACTEDVLSFIGKSISNVRIPIHLVLADDSMKIVGQLKDFEHVNVLIDKDFSLERYGLRYPTDLFFLIDHQSIRYWSFIEESHFKSIRRQLEKLEP
ncbi:MAG: hypothetical protein AAGG68_08900 [Bacteroidota bacterium]